MDTHHAALGKVSPEWFARTGFTFLSVRGPGKVPLVGVALQRLACPIDKTADTRILYWLSNLEKPTATLTKALAESVSLIKAEMLKTGSERVWGLVPRKAGHLVKFLDRMTDAGIARKVEGAGEYVNYVWYIGGRDEAEGFLGA